MKAGVAAALLACRAAAGLGLAGDVVVAAVADEEHASLGVQEALRRRPGRRRGRHRADGARRRRRPPRVRLGRDRGHGASPRTARARTSASTRSSRRGRSSPRSARSTRRWPERTHPLLGRGSVHASVIQGGVELSSYPARCVIGLERRTLPGETAASVAAELDALLDGCRAADPALVAEHRTLLVREPFEVAADAPFAAAGPRGGGGRDGRAAGRDRARATGPTPRSSRPRGSRRSCSARPAPARTRSRSGSASPPPRPSRRPLTALARDFCA